MTCKMLSRLWIVWLILGTIQVQCLYSSGSAVTQLSASNFHKVQKGIWLVQFYAPWCGHCKNLAPQYEKAAKALKGIAKIAVIDASNQKVNQDIKGFPTIKFYVQGKPTQDYNGERTANGIVSFVLNEFKKISNQRLGVKSQGSSSHNHGDSSGGSDEKDVIILSDADFDESVMNDKDAWFVEFYAPWCGHCQKLVPQWAALATNLKGEIKVAKVDATINKAVAGRFGVSGYPTIKFFPPGKKDDASVMDYNQARSENAMADWARKIVLQRSVFQHTQLTSQKVYDDNCKLSGKICAIAFLPHILDSSEEERNQYLETYKNALGEYRSRPFRFLWAQAGDLIDFENTLGILGNGYPAMIFLYETKKVYGRMMGTFTQSNLQAYFESIVRNKVKAQKLVAVPAIPSIKIDKKPKKVKTSEFHEEELCTEQKQCGKESQL